MKPGSTCSPRPAGRPCRAQARARARRPRGPPRSRAGGGGSATASENARALRRSEGSPTASTSASASSSRATAVAMLESLYRQHAEPEEDSARSRSENCASSVELARATWSTSSAARDVAVLHAGPPSPASAPHLELGRVRRPERRPGRARTRRWRRRRRCCLRRARRPGRALPRPGRRHVRRDAAPKELGIDAEPGREPTRSSPRSGASCRARSGSRTPSRTCPLQALSA